MFSGTAGRLNSKARQGKAREGKGGMYDREREDEEERVNERRFSRGVSVHARG